jgi:hypothetical protein
MPEIPIREAAYAALAATLAGLSIDGDAMTVERNRAADVDDAARPLLVLMDGDQDAEGGSTLEARYVIRAILAGYLDGQDDAQLAARVNEWHAQVVRAVMRPGGAGQVTDILLGDGLTAVRVEEGVFATEAATVVQSEAPMAACTLELRLVVHAPWGNPFITVP